MTAREHMIQRVVEAHRACAAAALAAEEAGARDVAAMTRRAQVLCAGAERAIEHPLPVEAFAP